MEPSLQKVFLEGRSHKYWVDKPVNEALLKDAYELARLGPTAANSNPMRLVFIKTPEAKQKLKPCLDEGNVEKTMKAPVTAIIAYDLKFYNWLPTLRPDIDARSWYVGHPKLSDETAKKNSTLQGAYFMLAARSLGLDCGPISGFDNELVDALFFAETSVKSNFLCNLGYGDPSKLRSRDPRFEFSEVCQIL